jgi:hypothetical protein
MTIDGNHQIGLNGDVGHSGGESSFSGTETIDNVKTRFSGCHEAYPRSAAYATADYDDCTDQNATPAGSGDGWGFYNTAGTWNITNSEWSHNTSDGLDLLYYGGPGESINIDKSLFEGNVGNQLKFWGNTVNVTNSVLIGNCKYLSDTNKVYNTGSFQSCRANGPPVAATPALGSTWKMYNNTIYSSNGSTGSSAVEVSMNSSDCNGTETYLFSNNIMRSPDGLWSAFYSGLTGACVAAFTAKTVDHSNIYGFSDNPSGTGNVFTDPLWASSINGTADSNLTAVLLTSSSPGKNPAGTSGNTFWNTSNDYYNNARASWDMGAFIYGSIPPAGGGGGSSTGNTLSGAIKLIGSLRYQ